MIEHKPLPRKLFDKLRRHGKVLRIYKDVICEIKLLKHGDAPPEVLAQQLRQYAGPIDWVIIDAGTGSEDCLSAARRALALG